MTISAQNISSVLQKRRAFGNLTLTPFEIEARLSTGPDFSADDAGVCTSLENSASFSRDESSGRLVFND